MLLCHCHVKTHVITRSTVIPQNHFEHCICHPNLKYSWLSSIPHGPTCARVSPIRTVPISEGHPTLTIQSYVLEVPKCDTTGSFNWQKIFTPGMAIFVEVGYDKLFYPKQSRFPKINLNMLQCQKCKFLLHINVYGKFRVKKEGKTCHIRGKSKGKHNFIHSFGIGLGSDVQLCDLKHASPWARYLITLNLSF